MSIIKQPAAVSGAVLVGTLSGDILYSAPYSVSSEAHVAPQLLTAFELVWQAIPEILGQLDAGRFDLVVRQRVEGQSEEAVTYWQSGLSAGALCGLVSRRLRQLRASVYVAPQQPDTGVTVTEMADDGSVEWTQPTLPPVERAREQLASMIDGVDVWGLRA